MLILGSACHVTFVPFRWRVSDLGILLPLLMCFGVSIAGGKGITFSERFAYGTAQSLLVAWIFEDAYRRELAFGSHSTVYLILIALVFGYAFLFACLTHALLAQSDTGGGSGHN